MGFRFTRTRGAPPDTAASRDDRAAVSRVFPRPPVFRLALLATPVVVALLGAAAYLVLVPRNYTGDTSVLIEIPAAAAAGAAPAEPALDEQTRRITSDNVLRRTAIAQALANDPEFDPKSSSLGARLARWFGPTGSTASDGVAQATDTLASHVTVKRLSGSPVVDIEVRSSEPAKAARLSDAVAAAFVEAAVTPIQPAAAQTSDQPEAARQAYETAVHKLDAFKRAHGATPNAGADGGGQTLADATGRLAEAMAHAADVAARLDAIKRAKSAGAALDTLPDTVSSPTLDKLRGQLADLSRQEATLRQTLGDRHPAMIQAEQQLRDVRRLAGAELGRLQAAAEAEHRSADADVAVLQARVQALKGNAATPVVDHRLQDLQTDVEVREAAYDRALRDHGADAPDPESAPVTRIIAPSSVPTTPSSPQVGAVLASAIALGLLTGLVSMLAGAVRNRTRARDPGASGVDSLVLDPGQAAPAEPSETQPLAPVLGSVPSPFGNPATLQTRDGLFDRFRTAWPTALDAEHVPTLPAFRAAVQALSLAEGSLARTGGGPRTLLVTSPDASDSRTTFALGLAEAAAGQGSRAIVIDADEQGSMLRELVTVSARPALIDLMGTSRICYRVLSSLRGSLSIVPIMPGESTLVRRLAAQVAATRIDGLAANFDLIVFDGPRGNQSSRLDAMAATVDAVLLVVSRGASPEAVDAAVASLAMPPGTPLSVVLVADLATGASSSAAA